MKKNEKGFALILSLVLLLVMTLMGGSLIIISSGDIQRNDSNDEYQQTFYVAESGLLAAERYLLDVFEGPWDPNTNQRNVAVKRLPTGSVNNWDGIMLAANRINYTDADSFYELDTEDMCFNSFRSIDRADFRLVLDHQDVEIAQSWNFGELIRDSYAGRPQEDLEEAEDLQDFIFEYFITRIGPASYKGTGSSIKKGATDVALDGMAYRIFACGIFQGAERMLIPIEAVFILPK